MRNSPAKTIRVPKYCLHKSTGQAFVLINGEFNYLGAYKLKPDGTPDCPRYHELVADWLTHKSAVPAPAQAPDAQAATPITVTEIIARYWPYASEHYRKADGRATSEIGALHHAIRPLLKMFGQTAASDFGPLKLKTYQQEAIKFGWSRKTINLHVQRIVRVFKWAVSCELVPVAVHQALTTVSGLKKGRTKARETEPVRPVPDAAVAAILPHVCATVASMIRLQRVTGMRSGELVIMRREDIDSTGPVWTYRPSSHKNEHHGYGREVPLGPSAQAILQPFLGMKVQGYVFTPKEAKGGRGGKRRRGPGERYTVASYRRVIARACDDAFGLPPSLAADWKKVQAWRREAWKVHKRPGKLDEMPELVRKARERVEVYRTARRWHPHQLRHRAATDLRAQFGIEAARLVLGHRSAAVTEIYAEADRQKAVEVMRQVG